MNITEQDIFNFVFHADSIDEQKREEITINPLYKNAVEFYLQIKDSIGSDLTFETKNKIAEKIDLYKPFEIFLFPIQEEEYKKTSSNLILAAASPVKQASIKTKTYIDEEKSILIKWLIKSGRSQVYIYSTQNKELRNISLTIEAFQKKLKIENNSQPVELEIDSFPPSLIVEFE